MFKKFNWPKILPELDSAQKEISDEFMLFWHQELSSKYSLVDHFNHNFVKKTAPLNFHKSLEIGAGNGEHISYEMLNDIQAQNYIAVDIRENMLSQLKSRFPYISTLHADCTDLHKIESRSIDRVIAIHVLEHIPDLPTAINELHRVCKKDGVLQVVIPCEGGALYSLARKISAQRIFEKKYKQSYRWFIEREHLNQPDEIYFILDKYFTIKETFYFPFLIPSTSINLCIGINLTPKDFDTKK
jgi:ubiquinone/menaquinone biosynthesis C-methylase UbiE